MTLGIGHDFFEQKKSSYNIKESINKLNYMRIKKLYFINMKRQVRAMNEICVYEIKQEYSGIYFQNKIT